MYSDRRRTLALEVLKKYIAKNIFLELKGAFTGPFRSAEVNGHESRGYFLFLDIQMRNINGIEFSRIVK